MKKSILLITILAMLICTGCSSGIIATTVAPTATKTTSPTPIQTPIATLEIENTDARTQIIRFDLAGERERIQHEFGGEIEFLESDETPPVVIMGSNWGYYFHCADGIFLAQYDNNLVRQFCVWIPKELYRTGSSDYDDSIFVQQNTIYPLADGGCYVIYTSPTIIDKSLYTAVYLPIEDSTAYVLTRLSADGKIQKQYALPSHIGGIPYSWHVVGDYDDVIVISGAEFTTLHLDTKKDELISPPADKIDLDYPNLHRLADGTRYTLRSYISAEEIADYRGRDFIDDITEREKITAQPAYIVSQYETEAIGWTLKPYWSMEAVQSAIDSLENKFSLDEYITKLVSENSAQIYMKGTVPGTMGETAEYFLCYEAK